MKRLGRSLSAAVLLLFLAASASAQTLTPHHVARIRSVTAATLSPGGDRVAYILSVPRTPLAEEDGPAWAELHITGPEGSRHPFVTGKVNVSNLLWMPDGKSVVFLMKRGTDAARSIYQIAVDGGEARRILAYETDIQSFSLSPDGKRVAFTARPPASKEKAELEKKGFNQDVYEEGLRFVQVFVSATGDGAAPRMLDLPGSASVMSWSPAGNKLVVALAPTPLVDDEYMARRIHVVDADSGKVESRVDNSGKLGQVAWSPDGRHIAFVSGADMNDPAAGRLMIAPVTGGPPRDLLPGYLGHVAAIGWRDKDTIAYLGEEWSSSILAEVRLDGGARKTLVPQSPTVLTGFDISTRAGSLALLGQSPSHPGELFIMRTGDAAPKRLTDSNPWLSGIRLAKQESVRFKARDGLEIEGVLVHPLDEQTGKRYPLILNVHGGPEAHDRNGWVTSYSGPGQVAAARGFAVFLPNYRGSTGRGVAFSKLGQGDAAGREFDDLVDAVDHLVGMGIADKSRVGITGGSYGGYASAWGATYYSDRFAAAVMFVGISDNISKAGTTDIPNEEFYVHALKRPWDDWKQMLERSPIYYLDRAKTPLLIMGGTADPRVSPTQSMELYRYLKIRNQAPVRLVRYPGEPHGNTRAAARLDYNLRMMQWMEHYLKGPGGTPPAIEIDYAEPKK